MSPVFESHRDIGVVWTRGSGCAELADLLAGTETLRVTGDLVEQCIDMRADLLVSRKLPGSFDLISVAVPIDFQPDKVASVVAAVAGGPHSLLAAQTAARLGSALEVPGEMVAAATRTRAEEDSPESVLEQIGAMIPGLRRRAVEVDDVQDLVDELDEDALLVIGAPGGSWLQRAFGPGARMRRTAQAGAIIVRSAPDRVFRFMGDPVYVAPMRQADDTLRIHDEGTLAVAEDGRLVGVVRRERLLEAGDQPVASLMEDAVSVKVDETLGEAWSLKPTFGTDPIPVTDHEEHLVGGLLLPVA